MLIKARISLTRLKEPGKLTLASKKNINTSRKIESIKKKESKNLEQVLLINNPANKNKPTEEKP